MKEFEYTNPNYCEPPGTFSEMLSHPVCSETKAIEKVIIKEHRFAFFYWVKWYREMNEKSKPPILVSIDYHRDLVWSDEERKELDSVSKYNLSELAKFCWARMNTQNDGHIYSAAYLNIIGDVILLKQQESFDKQDNAVFKDKFNNEHKIYEFDSLIELERYLQNTDYNKVFFDIDLDYFIEKVGDKSSRKGWEIMNSNKIKEIIDPKNEFIKWIYKRIEGFTIATEPSYCGGLLNSCRILSIIDEQLFDKNGKWNY